MFSQQYSSASERWPKTSVWKKSAIRQEGFQAADRVTFQPERLFCPPPPICHAQVSVSGNQSKTQHTGYKGIRLGELKGQDAFCKCLFMSASHSIKGSNGSVGDEVPMRLQRPASMHSVHSKIMKQMRLEVKSTDISCSECPVDLSVFSYF